MEGHLLFFTSEHCPSSKEFSVVPKDFTFYPPNKSLRKLKRVSLSVGSGQCTERILPLLLHPPPPFLDQVQTQIISLLIYKVL